MFSYVFVVHSFRHKYFLYKGLLEIGVCECLKITKSIEIWRKKLNFKFDWNSFASSQYVALTCHKLRNFKRKRIEGNIEIGIQ